MILRHYMQRRATTDIMYDFGFIADISQIIFFLFFTTRSKPNLRKEENIKRLATYFHMGLSNVKPKIIR